MNPDGRDHGSVSDLVDLLRPPYRFATRDHPDVFAVFINFLTVVAYAHFLHKEKEKSLAVAGSKSSL
jgi:hypothetical protein